MEKIPKIIHYCWFGKNPLPEDTKKYIETWRKYCPNYEIKEWNETNFDVNKNQYVKEAYEAKKFAFVSDYVRLYALYTEGGIYMDTDVEVKKPLDIFLKHKAFTGFENETSPITGTMGAEKNNKWIEKLLKDYDNISFYKENGEIDLTTNVERITKTTKELYNVVLQSSYQDLGDVTIYPFEYFCAKDWETGIINETTDTYTIHHFKSSWHTKEEKETYERRKKYIIKYGKNKGNKIFKHINRIRNLFFHPLNTIKKILKNVRGNNK